MKYLRLYSDDAACDKYGFLWDIPLKLVHEEVGLSSVHVELQEPYSADISNTVIVQCSLVKETMWNTRGIFYNLDLTRGDGWTFSARPGGVGGSCSSYANINIYFRIF